MNQVKNILVTGASGFVGQALCQTLLQRDYKVRAIFRNSHQCELFNKKFTNLNFEAQNLGDLSEHTNWEPSLEQIDVVIHLVARTHITREHAHDPLLEFRKTNVEISRQLAQSAVTAGVQHFIYLSSVKVNGEQTQIFANGSLQKFTEQDSPNPQDFYGLTKWEAEQELHKIQHNSSMKLTILRPPLVYGRGVKANFQQLIKLVKTGLPLPFANTRNYRSLIYLDNLIDAIILCLQQQKSYNQTYLLSDALPVSMAELIRHIAFVFGKKARLWPMPLKLLFACGKITGKQNQLQKLFGSLVVDMTKIQRELNWQPPFTLQQALKRDFK